MDINKDFWGNTIARLLVSIREYGCRTFFRTLPHPIQVGRSWLRLTLRAATMANGV